ncbi:retrovirus-related pol polyprotein from transposon TNT 1-94 [Tanacetum coccineum]
MVDTRNSAKGVDRKNSGRPLKSILKKLGDRHAVNVNEEIAVGLKKGAIKNTTAGGVTQQYDDVNTNIVEESPSMVQRRVTMTPVVMVHNFEVDYRACITESNGANDGQLVGVVAVIDSNNMGVNRTNTSIKSNRAVEVEVVVQQPRDSINADKVGTDDEHNENIFKQVGSQPVHDGSTSETPSFASILCPKLVSSKIHFCTLVNDEKLDSFDCVLLQGAEYMVKGRYDNSLVGEVTKVPVWVKMHNVSLLAYSKDGLSLIATQIGKPIMFDVFTSSMCVESWGRISFAQAHIEVSLDSELKNEVIMVVPTTPSVVATVLGSMEDHEEGFVEINRRKKKGKAGLNQHCQISGIKLSKPKSNFQYRPVFKPGKDMDDASNLGANGSKEDSSDSFEANKASKQTSSEWTKDFESDDEVLYPEGNKFGDQFDIRLKGRYKKFIINYNMNNVESGILAELHNMLKTAKRGIEQNSKDVLVVAGGNGGKWKGIEGNEKKNKYSNKVFKGFKPSRGYPCYKCGKEGHWSRTCPNGPTKKDKENTAKTSG